MISLKYKDRIHIHSRNGTYTVAGFNETHITLTTQKWCDEFSRGERKTNSITVPIEDYNCHASEPFQAKWRELLKQL